MYWFRRPPYFRWAASALVVAGALWMDLRGTPTELRPFAVADIEAGAAIQPEMVEYRAVPAGFLPEVNLVGFTLTSIPAGDPVTPALLTDRSGVPDGWWALEMGVPSGVIPGTELRLAIEADAGIVVPGVVIGLVSPEAPGGWSENTALVAVPSDQAATVATSLARAGVSVLVVDW
ncbi:MAG: SAF domain-containing protein [Acidimicrobiia bacterium]|nr:SAF domain-containing protein [Acidimicrobiia bacterium]